MKKVLIIIVIAAIAAGAAWFFFLKEDEEVVNKEVEVEEVISSEDEWNPYAAEENYVYVLPDQLLSVAGGSHIVKMNATIQFATKDGYYRFLGFSDRETAEKNLEGEHEGDAALTPMGLKINDVVGMLLMKATEQQLTDRTALKVYLKDGINEALGFKNPVVGEVFIENFVLQ